jgi:hypothetical protein
MFICNACGNVSKPKEPSNSWISEKRKKNYELLDKNGERVGVVTGWEIKKEIRLCSGCYSEARRAEEYLEHSDGAS